MASNFTEHFQLNQWEASDQVLREDFNEDNVKIDGALAGLAARTGALEQAVAGVVTVGSYEASPVKKRSVQLPFVPKMLILFGIMTDEIAMAFLTQDFCYLQTRSLELCTSEYAPVLNGSVLTLNDWFSRQSTTSYIAFR